MKTKSEELISRIHILLEMCEKKIDSLERHLILLGDAIDQLQQEKGSDQ